MPRGSPVASGNKRKNIYTTAGVLVLILVIIYLSFHAFGRHTSVPPTLQLVTVIFRHGDRTPTHFYPNDPYKDLKYWPDGVGALTKTGKQQMYKLGKFIRKQYGGFISEKYSPDDIYVFSSDRDRCLMSAELCLAGLYPPVGDQIWNSDLNWQPIPVHTVPRNLDNLITVKKPCPNYDKALNQSLSSSYFDKINADNVEMYNYLTKHSGMLVNGVSTVEYLYNILEVEEKSQLELPHWTSKYYSKLKELASLSLASLTFTTTTKRLKGGPLLGDIVNKMSQKVLGLLKPDRSMYLYSGHDVTLISLLRTLGFDEYFKPDYGASVIFELHQPLDEGDHLVHLLYLNNTEQPVPVKLQIPGCEKTCTLTNFITITKSVIPEDWEAECHA